MTGVVLELLAALGAELVETAVVVDTETIELVVTCDGATGAVVVMVVAVEVAGPTGDGALLVEEDVTVVMSEDAAPDPVLDAGGLENCG